MLTGIIDIMDTDILSLERRPSWSWTLLIKPETLPSGSGVWSHRGPCKCRALVTHGGKDSPPRLHAFLASVRKLLVQLHPSCILWPRTMEVILFFSLHNPKGRVVESGQGQVGRGWNKILGSFTLQGCFSLCRRTHTETKSLMDLRAAPPGGRVR